MGYTTNVGADRIETGQVAKEPTLVSMADIFDTALAGRMTRSVAGSSNVTLTDAEGRNARLELTGALTGNIVVFVRVPGGTTPGYCARRFSVLNSTTGAFTLTVKTTMTGSTGIALTQGKLSLLEHNGTNVYRTAPEIDPATGALGFEAAWPSWTPTWTNLTVGNAVVDARYIQIGKTVLCRFSIVLGDTSSVSGSIILSLPITSRSYGGSAGTVHIGNVRAVDASVPAYFPGSITWVSTTTAGIQFYDSSGTYLQRAVPSPTVPFTWTTSDEIGGEFFYEAA